LWSHGHFALSEPSHETLAVNKRSTRRGASKDD
jgi:hypothetical protein